jgi:DMSO/TMAO reductase YedYZ molybdopterin-dependent catalytic subunit
MLYRRTESIMSDTNPSKRRTLLGLFAAGASCVVAGCDKLGDTPGFQKVLALGESLNRTAHKFAGRRSMAQEFTAADLSPTFRGNGNTNPDDKDYQTLAKAGFVDWALEVHGLVERPTKFTLEQLKNLPSRTQITRHDCVEGWSAIGKWTGVPLAAVLAAVKPGADARYVVFHCADNFAGEADESVPYYESIDLDDAYHVQTILAYQLNDQTLPITNGAPLRLRVERQLGYKQAKYIMKIELVKSFEGIGKGKGGYWEDRGYQWYAGI